MADTVWDFDTKPAHGDYVWGYDEFYDQTLIVLWSGSRWLPMGGGSDDFNIIAWAPINWPDRSQIYKRLGENTDGD